MRPRVAVIGGGISGLAAAHRLRELAPSVELAEKEVADLLHIRGAPNMRRITRQPRAMPQYHVGHRDRVAQIEARLSRRPTLAVASSALGGVGVPRCVQSGETAATHLASLFSRIGTARNQPACV
jgi:protoporphyrinogen oxidase